MPRDPDQLVDLVTARTEFEAVVIQNTLQTSGIPARAFGIVGSTLGWEIAASQPIRVQVRRQDLERARAALERVRQDSVDIDWSEVESEAEGPAACPACGYDLRSGPGRAPCPECGGATADQGQTSARSRPAGPPGWTRGVSLLVLGATLIGTLGGALVMISTMLLGR